MDDTKKLAGLLSSLAKKSAEDGKGRFEELLYAEKLRKKMPPVRVVVDDWHAYDGAAWVESTRHEFLPLALSTCPKRYRKARHAANLLDHLEAESQVKPESLIGFHKFVTHEDTSRSILINAANGVVRIWPGGEVTLEKHDPEFGFTSHAEAKWDEAAKCELFEQVHAQSLPDVQDRLLNQVFCGNILWPSAEFEVAMISYGRAGTSKSTIAEAVAFALASPEARGSLVSSLSMTQICDSRSYSLPKLKFASLNLGTEVDTIDLDESTNFKQLVSGETLEVRQIYGKPGPMRSSVKLWFLANILPRFKTGTDAELRRLRFVQYEVVPEKRDPSLKVRLRAERDGIFRWMVEGLVMLQRENGVPHGGDKSRKIVEKFSISNDPVGWFIRNRCELGREHKVKKEWMKAAFIGFLEDHGLPEQFEGYFFRRLYERFPEVSPLRQRAGSGVEERYVGGIRLVEQPLAGLL